MRKTASEVRADFRLCDAGLKMVLKDIEDEQRGTKKLTRDFFGRMDLVRALDTLHRWEGEISSR